MLTLKSKKRYNIIQILVIAFIWVLMFAIPLLFGNFPKDNDWVAVFEIWRGYGYLFLLFLTNHFVLLPNFFFKQRRVAYFAIATLMIVVFFSIIYTSYVRKLPERPDVEMGFQDRYRGTSDQADFQQRAPHPNPRGEKPRPDEDFHPEDNMQHGPEYPPREELQGRRIGPLPQGDMGPVGRGGKPEPGIPPYANLLILAILLLGFDTALSISMKWIEDEQKRIELEKENTENKLIFLRQQVSPHFFMNTLNNIHALIDINQEQAKESVIKLSKLMNYLIYDTQDGKVMLKDELAFIDSYIELMQLRFSNKVKIDVQIPSVVPQVEIAPLLFISFIENAFKYGISYQAPSFVRIVFSFEKDHLKFVIDNSLFPKKEKREKSGFGIENTRKRLELLYSNAYNLNIIESAEQFSVKLKLPL